MVRLDSVTVRIDGERGAIVEQRDSKMGAIGLAALTTGLRSSISKAVRSPRSDRQLQGLPSYFTAGSELKTSTGSTTSTPWFN